MPGLMHLVSLKGVAGVEVQFAEFVARAAARHPRFSHSWLNPTRAPCPPALREQLEQGLDYSAHTKYRRRVKLPARPASIRSWHCRRARRDAGADLLLIWNRTARINFVVDAFGAENCIHFEHGAAWFSGHERDRQRYLQRIPLAIANSRAAARVLQLLWRYPGETRICRNALRPSMTPARAVQKRWPQGRAIRIGVATRLAPVKGLPLALHAVRQLTDRGLDVELHVAGDGPELARMRTLAERLGVASATRFHGFIEHVDAFYARVDCLLHAPLTEAFGLVAIEAAAHGCPVIAAAVDGLPEAVADGVSGHCVRPALPLGDYARLGGTLEGLPPYVYDPSADALREPGVADPAALADRLEELFSSQAHYERLSLSASEHVLRDLRFDTHVDEVIGVVDFFLSGRTEAANADRAVSTQP